MSELLREAILGTAHTAGRTVDGLVGKVDGIDRERALLLGAAAEALLRRAGRVLPQRRARLPAAEPETLRVSSLPLTAAMRALLEEQSELLEEALTRMARAGVRLAPELLPLALDQSAPELRALLRPVLGRRGVWLAQTREAWAWARAEGEGPMQIEPRWSEGNAAERRQLFRTLRQQEPARARELAAETWKHERADQRMAFAEAFTDGLSPDDQGFLRELLADRSAHVQHIAARLLSRLPGSEVAQRMLARARAHVRFEPQQGQWQIELPAEPLDPGWLRDGISEQPPDASPLGKRQWWLQQLIAAVPCATWIGAPHAASQPPSAAGAAQHKQATAEAQREQAGAWQDEAAVAALGHEFAGVLLDGLTRAALQFDERGWFAPLWDAWAQTDLPGATAPDPRVLLSAKLTPPQVAARAQQLVSEDRLRGLLPHLRPPWPESLALRVLAAIADLRLPFREIIPVAARAIPVALLPDALPLPELKQVEYPMRAYVRALADFQDLAALRRSIAAETTGDD